MLESCVVGEKGSKPSAKFRKVSLICLGIKYALMGSKFVLPTLGITLKTIEADAYDCHAVFRQTWQEPRDAPEELCVIRLGDGLGGVKQSSKPVPIGAKVYWC